MIIINDVIAVGQLDFVQFSPSLQLAITSRAGQTQTPTEYLSARFNAVLQEGLYLEKQLKIGNSENQVVLLAFADSNPGIQAQVKSLLGI